MDQDKEDEGQQDPPRAATHQGRRPQDSPTNSGVSMGYTICAESPTDVDEYKCEWRPDEPGTYQIRAKWVYAGGGREQVLAVSRSVVLTVQRSISGFIISTY